MTQKIHGDLEVTGDLTVGGSAPGGGGPNLVLQLRGSTSVGPSTTVSSSYSAYVVGKRGIYNLIAIVDESSIWDTANDEFTIGASGKYLLTTPCFKGQRVNSTIVYGFCAFIKRSPSEEYVPYFIQSCSTCETASGHLRFTPASSVILEFEAGDVVRLGTMNKTTNAVHDPAILAKAHHGLMSTTETEELDLFLYQLGD